MSSKNPIQLEQNRQRTEELIIRLDEQLENIGEKLSYLELELRNIRSLTAGWPQVQEQIREMRVRLQELQIQMAKLPQLEQQISDLKIESKETQQTTNKVFQLEGKFAIAVLIIGTILTGLMTYTVSQVMKQPQVVIQPKTKGSTDR
ncbi:MAG: hypothetical protein CL920_30125 [Deltaproteobacteria bacterium]|nr:hypothetical protein [Deltaproteobacteria bacterium]MBU52970.1 hypothetical protein [Deltaproteobacteria bacterium]